MRRLTTFPCAGDILAGTFDEAAGATGLLIVSGGNEVRMGAHRGQAMLAARLAQAGVPVFRFDRRGIGDSEGENRGWEGSAEDIRAAAATFRRESGVTRILGFGNCDAATALTLFGRAAGIDALVLANPWVVAHDDALPPAAAIRARYADRLRDPAEWWRLLRGGVNLRKLVGGLAKVAATPRANPLADRVIDAIRSHGATTIILARSDATALAFQDASGRAALGLPAVMVDTGSHSFARPGDQDALFTAIFAALWDDAPSRNA